MAKRDEDTPRLRFTLLTLTCCNLLRNVLTSGRVLGDGMAVMLSNRKNGWQKRCDDDKSRKLLPSLANSNQNARREMIQTDPLCSSGTTLGRSHERDGGNNTLYHTPRAWGRASYLTHST